MKIFVKHFPSKHHFRPNFKHNMTVNNILSISYPLRCSVLVPQSCDICSFLFFLDLMINGKRFSKLFSFEPYLICEWCFFGCPSICMSVQRLRLVIFVTSWSVLNGVSQDVLVGHWMDGWMGRRLSWLDFGWPVGV